MMRIATITLLVGLLSSVGTLAQEPADQETKTAEQDAALQEDKQPPSETPEIDVWAEDDDSEDVFVPTESISADASIAFPADI